MLGFTQPHTIGEAVANRSLQPSRAIQDHLLTDKPGDTRSDANTQPTGHRYQHQPTALAAVANRNTHAAHTKAASMEAASHAHNKPESIG
jgi:hypothetical protein